MRPAPRCATSRAAHDRAGWRADRQRHSTSSDERTRARPHAPTRSPRRTAPIATRAPPATSTRSTRIRPVGRAPADPQRPVARWRQAAQAGGGPATGRRRCAAAGPVPGQGLPRRGGGRRGDRLPVRRRPAASRARPVGRTAAPCRSSLAGPQRLHRSTGCSPPARSCCSTAWSDVPGHGRSPWARRRSPPTPTPGAPRRSATSSRCSRSTGCSPTRTPPPGRVPTDAGYRYFVDHLLPRSAAATPRELELVARAPRGRRGDARHHGGALAGHEPARHRHRAAARHRDDPPRRGARSSSRRC